MYLYALSSLLNILILFVFASWPLHLFLFTLGAVPSQFRRVFASHQLETLYIFIFYFFLLMGSNSHDSEERKQPKQQPEQTPLIQDCLSCRVIGTVTCGGCGAYILHHRSLLKTGDVRGRLIMGGVASIFFGLGAYRAVMPATWQKT